MQENGCVRFTDVYVIYLIGFDLGKPIESKAFAEWFANSFKIVEMWWAPHLTEPTLSRYLKERRNLAKQVRYRKAFEELIKQDRTLIGLPYLERERYARLKLIELMVHVKDNRFKFLHKCGLECIPYLLVHNSGVAIITLWLHVTCIEGGLTTDEIIMMEKELYDARCSITASYPIGESIENEFLKRRNSLRELAESLMRILQGSIMYSEKSFEESFRIFREKLRKDEEATLKDLYGKLRRTLYRPTVVTGIAEHVCECQCKTAFDALKYHRIELSGILNSTEGWRLLNKEAIDKSLNTDNNLSYFTDDAFFIGPHWVALWIGSKKLDEGTPLEELDVERMGVLNLYLSPLTLVKLLRTALDVYNEYAEERLKTLLKKGSLRGISELRAEVEKQLSNIELLDIEIIPDPTRSVIERAKEVYKVDQAFNMIRNRLEWFSQINERVLNEGINRLQILIGVLTIISLYKPLHELLSQYVYNSLILIFPMLSALKFITNIITLILLFLVIYIIISFSITIQRITTKLLTLA